MADFSFLAKALIGLGVGLALLGLILLGLIKFLAIGRLPGDVVWQRDGFTLYFPVASSIILSVILTILLNFFVRR